MATVRKTTIEPPDLASIFEAEVTEKSFDEIGTENLLAELEGVEGAVTKVYRILPNNKLAWLYDCHPSEFNPDDLRDVYEGGNFVLRVYDMIDGRKTLKGTPRVSIEAPKRKLNEHLHQAPSNNDMQNLMATMMTGFNELGKLMVLNQNQNQAPALIMPPIDPMKMQADMMQNMLVMKQLLGGSETKTEPAQGAIDMMLKGIELGKAMNEVRGESSSTDVLMEAVKNFGAPLMQGIMATQAQVPATAPIIPRANVPVIPAAPLKPTESNEMNFIQKQKLKMSLSFLCDAAERDLSTETYAEIAIDNLSDDELIQILDNPNVVNTFIPIEPRVATHIIWLEKMVANIREMLEPETDEETIDETMPIINLQTVNEAGINSKTLIDLPHATNNEHLIKSL